MEAFPPGAARHTSAIRQVGHLVEQGRTAPASTAPSLEDRPYVPVFTERASLPINGGLSDKLPTNLRPALHPATVAGYARTQYNIQIQAIPDATERFMVTEAGGKQVDSLQPTSTDLGGSA